MKFGDLSKAAVLLTAAFAFSGESVAQLGEPQSRHATHHYTAYEKIVHKTASTFHKNFNNHEFEKNKALVVDDLHVNSNGTEFRGASEYVSRISRFVGPFPDVKITDLSTVVDGNMASIRFVITGTHKGDLATPDGVIRPTGKQIKIDGIEYATFNKEGKLIDLLTVEDLAGLFKQLKN